VSTVALPAATSRPARSNGEVVRTTIWRRRLVAVALLVVLAFALTVAIGRVGAGAELDDPVAGHVVVTPGETLWDVAVATAPEGMDVRRHLADLEALNGFEDRDVAAWTVVLLPAR
jgi:hypothetical protein